MANSYESGKILVHEIMSKKMATINLEMSVLEISKIIIKKKVSSVAAIDKEGKIIGIITERDLVRTVCAKDVLSSSLIAMQIMSSPLLSIDKNTTIKEAAKLMVEKRIRHLPVTSMGNIIGVITATDLVGILRNHIREMKLDTNLIDAVTMTEIPLEEGGLSLPLDEGELKS